FPAYTLGSINSVQIFSAIKRAYPDWQARLLIGDVIFIREWLEANIWSIGSLKDSQELIQQATGEQTNSRYFLDYLKERYLDEAY
ncbi:MAG: carboxypeptidase M32, partial [Desulfobulbaceae bacterium]